MANKETIRVQLQAIMDVSNVQDNVKQIQNVLSQLKLPDNLKTNFTRTFSDIEQNLKKAQNAIDSGFKTKNSVNEFTNSMTKVNGLLRTLQTSMQRIDTDVLTNSFTKNEKEIKSFTDSLTKLQEQLKQAIPQSTIDNVNSIYDSFKKVTKSKALKELRDAFEIKDIDKINDAFKRLEENGLKFFSSDKQKIDKGEYAKFFLQLKEQVDSVNTDNIKNIVSNINDLEEKLRNAGETQLADFVSKFKELSSTDLSQLINGVNQYSQQTSNAGRQTQQLSSEIDKISNKIQYFFSLTNAVYLFRRAVNGAIDTIKELDATMTETAVVTDFTVGDMWSQLPEYTKRANELGISINSAYKAATLYYQQGLNTNQVMAVSNETLKMARIAGLDAADATDKMTAALRGFNMEINEGSAQRVNDVYSKLAAITASDVEEISTAMTKTASIASNANMEFETTAAFLSQIIETTRESAETAGTAMKTVIARFTELKKDPAEIGEVDGEIVDANKIEGALRTVGVALRDAQGQFRDLDDVFLELASKWDSLDTNTQRYIATMAAGSRQQSRFIAMMSNYERTMELVEAANTSAGASEEQFSKTLDSLETKLNQLKNTWDEFTMSITNNAMIKSGVDILNALLTTVNKVTQLFGDAGSMVAKLGIALVSLKIGKTFFNTFLTNIVTNFQFIGKAAADKFDESFNKQLQERQKRKNFNAAQLNLLSSIANGTGDISKLSNDFADKFQTQLLQSIKSIDDKNIADTLTNKINNIPVNSGVFFNKLQEAITNDDNGKYLSESIQKTAELIENDLTNAMQNAQIKATKLAGALSGIGMAFGLISKGLKDAGYEEWSKYTSDISSELMVVSGILMTLPSLLQSIGVAASTIPIIGQIAAIASGLYMVYNLIKSIAKDNSLETRIEKAKDATKAAKEVADSAAQSYQSLLGSIKEYDEITSSFDNLIEGTQEWNEALIKSNQLVMELIDLYPQLKKKGYLSISNGRLEINNQGFSELSKMLYQSNKDAITLSQSSQAYESALKTPNSNGLIDQANTNFAINAEFKPGEIVPINLDWSQMEVKSISNIDITEIGESIVEKVSDTIPTLTLGNVEFTKNISDAIESSLDDIDLDGKTISKKLASGYGKLISPSQFLDDVDKEISQLNKDYTDNNKFLQDYANTFAKNIDDLNVANIKEYKQQVAQFNVSKRYAKQANNFATTLVEKVTAPVADAVLSALDSSDALTGDQFELIFDESGQLQTDIKSKLDTITSSLSFSEEDASQILNNIQTSGRGYADFKTKIEDQLNKVGIGALSGVINTISKSSIDSLISQFQQTASSSTGGLTVNSQIAQQIASLSNQLDSDKYKQFLEALAATPWQDADALEGLSIQLKELEISSDNVDLTNIINQIGKAANASKTFNLDKLTTSLKNAKEIIKDLEDRAESERDFDEETFAKIQSLLGNDFNKEEWVWDGTQYTYIGNAINNLITALQNNTNALTSGMFGGVEERIYYGQKWQQWNQSSDPGMSQLMNALNSGSFNLSTLLGAPWSNSDVINAITTVLKGNDRYFEGYTDQLIKDAQAGDASARQVIQDLLVSLEQNRWNGGQVLSTAQAQYNQAQDLKYSSLSTTADKFLASAVTERDKQLQTDAINADFYRTTGADDIYDRLIKEKGSWDQLDESIKNIYGDEVTYTNQLKTISVESKKAEKKLNQLQEAVNKYSDALQEGSDASDEFDEYLKTAQDLFGEEVNADFVKTYVDDFKLLTKGGKQAEEAFEKLRAKLNELRAKEFQKQFGEGIVEAANKATDGAVENIEGFAAWLAGLDLKFDVTARAQFQEFLGKLTEAEILTEETFDTIAAIIGKISGQTIELVPIYSFGVSETTPGAFWSGGTDGYGAITGWTYKVTGGENASPLDFTIPAGGGGGSGGSSAKEESWKNPYDKFYNTIEDIAELQRQQVALQRNLEKNSRSYVNKFSAADIAYNQNQRLNNLNQQEELQRKLQQGYADEIQKAMASSEYGRYSHYNFDDMTIEINWDAINAITDSDYGSGLEEYISHLEDLQSKMDDATDALYDIEDAIWDIQQEGKQEFDDLEQQTLDALVNRYQQNIDEMNENNNNINKANADLLNSLRDSIDKQRQERENQKTEENLSNMQSRLDYLRQDTSGANALEIKQLEKQLADAQEDYTDTLIDQKLTDIQDQNDFAAKQREEQIELAQNYLDWAQKTGVFWAEVYSLINTGFDDKSKYDVNSELNQLLKEYAGYNGMSDAQQADFQKATTEQATTSAAYLYRNKDTEGYEKVREDYAQLIDNVDKNTPEVNENTVNTQEFSGSIAAKTINISDNDVQYGDRGEQRNSGHNDVADTQYALNVLGYGNSGTYDCDGVAGNGTREAIINYQLAHGLEPDGIVGSKTAAQMEKDLQDMGYWVNTYKTGGLADFTGPAWLDGTKSKPELVLNARDTENFIALKDVLADAMKGSLGTTPQRSGDAYYNFDINVDQLASDYDIEQVADKIKSMITENARYRNVTAVNFSR